MTSFALHPALRDRVTAIDVVTSRGALEVLPSTSAVLGFQLQGRIRAGAELLATAGVTGLQEAARCYEYVGDTASILVRFTAQGATSLGVPASELSRRSVDLGALLPPALVRQAHEQLHDGASVAAQVATVQALLLRLPYAEDRLVARALRQLEASAPEASSVAAIARALEMSERQLERRFLARVGVTPKAWATLRRFERAVALAATAPSLTSVALDAGYYDQSHFIRDFRRRAGRPPGALLRR